MKRRKSFIQRHWQLLLIVFAFVSVGVASAAILTPDKQSYAHSNGDGVAVYRPSEKAWVEIDLEDLQPLDFLLKDGKAYHVKAAYSAATGQVQAAPLGATTRATLDRHLGNFDPEDKSYPLSDNELVYAKWESSELWTFQPLGKLRDGDLFQHNGREFLTRVHTDGSREVKPTGNVLSEVTGVWSEHHDNQIHLTLFFPERQETSKIITTHEHPFYVPGEDEAVGEWIPAADLKVGMALQTCDGTPARVADWVVVDEPFTAWNIEVAHSHTYYVADNNNPDAPPVLVHNDCSPFAKLKDHYARHGEALGVKSANQYLRQASDHVRTGTKFAFRHDGIQKTAHITRLGQDKFMFTSSLGGRRVLTHLAVDRAYLSRQGITLPNGF